MKLDSTLRRAIAQAAERFDGAGKLGKKAGIDPGTVSRYINGKINSISDENWSKLEKVLKEKEIVQEYSNHLVLEQHEVEKDPRSVLCSERSEIALRIKGNDMAPTVCDRDVIVAEKLSSLQKLPENRILLVLRKKKEKCTLCCRRLWKIGGQYWFCSDAPQGEFFPVDPENILWVGMVLRKICEL